MNRTPYPALAIRISAGAALAALVSFHVACSDDDHASSGSPEAGTGGEAGSGGRGTGGTGTGGRPSGGAGGGTAGSGGAAGAGGGAGGKDGGAPETGSSGGAGGGVPDASIPDASAPDAAPDGPPEPPPCGAPADPNKAKLCLAFDPEVVRVETDPFLDGKGTLHVEIFDVEPSTAATDPTPIKSFVYPTLADGGLEETDVYSLSEVTFDGLPETVYVQTFFADNPFYDTNRFFVTYGVFVGGLDLTQGVVDLSTGNVKATPVRAVTLKKGEGTRVTQILHAMRKFTTTVALDVPQASIGDDGQGVISVGWFDVPAPAGQPVLGGGRSACVNLLTQSPVEVTGFVYGTGDFWLGGQLDDFNQGGLSKPGDIVSLGEGANGQSIPAAQKLTITDQYSVNIPTVSLNTVLPGFTGLQPYACP